MKTVVNQETCIGCGLCVSACDKVYKLNEDGKAYAGSEDVLKEYEDKCKEAEEGCPVGAIKCE